MDQKNNYMQILKRLIIRLHEGGDPEEVKKEFRMIVEKVSPTDIARVEEELISEGMPREEIHQLCDVHLALFRESLEKEKSLASPGHPVHILMQEHNRLIQISTKLKEVTNAIRGRDNFDSMGELKAELTSIVEQLKDSENHYLREENVLFPYLEKKGVTQPPAIMWMEHDQIRKMKKHLYHHVEICETIEYNDFSQRLVEVSQAISEMLSDHFFKESRILFPAALDLITKNEWIDIRNQFDELGYCSFTPKDAIIAFGKQPLMTSKSAIEGVVSFETGSLSREELDAIFNTLPLDLTYVDKDDTVRYFNQPKERIFVRTKAVIGRKVEHCHPQKSLHIVKQILKNFKNGSRDEANFWINLKGKLVLIRFYPIRNINGDYLGCLEIMQDVTDIKMLQGEKRLLD
jgi:PAS domain S-box-containing protein